MTEGQDRKPPKVLEHLGPYYEHEPVRKFSDIAERCWTVFHRIIGGEVRRDEKPREHLATRMIYLSETTSVAARLNASWALSIPAMSLVRNRYEQLVRHSWLARQENHAEALAFIDSYYAKSNKIYRLLNPEQKEEFDRHGPHPDWITASLSKEQRALVERWESHKLDQLAQRRDKLRPLSDRKVAKEMLLPHYTPVYRQFSSAAHFDMYAVNMLGLHKAPGGVQVLAPDPFMPAFLCLYDALFSLVQCYEVSIAFYGASVADADPFDALLEEWSAAQKRLTG